MSYSFSVVASDKVEVTRQIREQFDGVVAAQPTHAADKEAVVVAAQSLVRLLAEPQGDEEIHVSMYGSLSWRSDKEFIAAGATINVSLRNKS